MPVALGRWFSPGAVARTKSFLESKKQTVEMLEPGIQGAAASAAEDTSSLFSSLIGAAQGVGRGVEGLQRRNLGGLARGFTPTGAGELQAGAFQGLRPQEVGGRAAQRFFQDVPEPGEQRRLALLKGELDRRGLRADQFQGLLEQARSGDQGALRIVEPIIEAVPRPSSEGVTLGPPDRPVEERPSPGADLELPATELQRGAFAGLRPEETRERVFEAERQRALGLPAGFATEVAPRVGLTPSEAASFQDPFRPGTSVFTPIEAARVLEEPIARPLGEAFIEGFALPGAREGLLERVPGAREAATEVFRPTNFVPIPIIEPAIARAAGIIFRAGVRVTPRVLREFIAKAATRLAESTLPPAERVALQEFQEQGTRTLTEAGVETARGAPLEAGVRRPVEEAPLLGAVPEVQPAAAPVAAEATGAVPPVLNTVADVAEDAARRGLPPMRGGADGVTSEIDELQSLFSSRKSFGRTWRLASANVAGENGLKVNRLAGRLGVPLKEPTAPNIWRQLGDVFDDLRKAAVVEPGTAGGIPPMGGGAVTGLPSSRALKTIEEVAEDAVRSTQNAAGALARGVARFPPLRTLVDFINPSALIERPPASLVDELGQEGATQLQSQLIAHGRMMDQGTAMASAIEEGIQQRARAVGFDVEDGLVVSVDGSPPVGDMFENPSRYRLTSEQRKLVDEVQAVLNDMNAVEKAAGVKKGQIFSGEGRYFPRLVREVRGVENVRADVRRIVGGKQGFSRERFYETMQEGIDAGVRYNDDIGAIVGTRIRAGMKATGDEGLGQLLRPLGRTLKAPKRTPGIGELGTMVPALGGRAFPPETAKAIMDALNPAPPGSTLRFLDGLNNLLRPIQATGELSFWGIQMMSSIFRNPAAFAKGALYSLDGLLLDGRLYGRFIQNNAPWIERFIGANGVWNASEFTFEQAVRNKTIRKVFETTGLKGALGRFDQAFNQALNVTALENFKGMVGLGNNVGFDKFNRVIRAALGNFAGENVDEVAASVASKATGRVPVRGLGVKATQRSVESSVAFASRYYRAMFGLLGDAIQGGMRGAESRRILGSLFAGAIAAHVGAARALGQEPNLDPRNSNWLTVRVGDTQVGIGGPIYGLGRMLAESVENPDKLKGFSMDNPLVRWARGRTAPVLSLATDLVTQKTFLGKKIDSPGDLFREIATTPLPFIAQQTIEEGPEGFPPQFFGLRSFPTSPFSRLQDTRQEVMREQGLEGSFRDLKSRDPIAAARVNEDSRVQQEQSVVDKLPPRDLRGQAFDFIDTLRERQFEEQSSDDQRLTSGQIEGNEWRRNRGDREGRFFQSRQDLQEFAGIKFGDVDVETGTVGAAVDAYFEIDPDAFKDDEGRIDWLAVDLAQDEALESLSDDEVQDFQRLILGHHDTPLELRYRLEGRQLRDDLGDIQKYTPFPVSLQRKLEDFRRDMLRAREQRKDQIGSENVESVADFMRIVGPVRGQSANFIEAAINIGSSRWRAENLNPEYERFIVTNRDPLLTFYPDLRNDRIGDLILAVEQVGQ